jgi:GNAT superfamily N-acetyltransferase
MNYNVIRECAMVRYRQILESEIQQLKNFPPEEWKLDLPRLFTFHFGHSYFYPCVAEADGRIIGCGINMIHADICWLGTIIVLPEYRNQGIGQKITRTLIEYGRSKGCMSFLLTASEMGESIYRKLGFETDSTYLFYKKESIIPSRDVQNVRPMQQKDYPAALDLDREGTGENRAGFIERFLSTGWIYSGESTGHIDGFYLPDLSNGLIIARHDDAGLELMKVRLNRGKTTAIIPEINTSAHEFLHSQDFQEYRRSPRMVLGKAVQWQPRLMYNRATGYCG